MTSTRLTIIFPALTCLLGVSGCSVFEGEYNPQATFTQGEKPSYNVAAIHEGCNDENGKLKDTDQCKFPTKALLTNTDSNMTLQFIKTNGKGDITNIITCASPAESSKAQTTSANGTVSLPLGSNNNLTISSESSDSQSIVLVQPTDVASHFVATATYAHCQAYANGVFGDVSTDPSTKTAAINAFNTIITQAAEVEKASMTPAPAQTAAAALKPPTNVQVPTVTLDSSKKTGSATVTFKSDSTASTVTYAVTPNPADTNALPNTATDSDKDKASLSHVVTGLTAGNSYTFSVTATDSSTKQTSGYSLPSIPVPIK